MRLTLIHPCIGRRAGQKYIRTWQMEPLAPALVAALTPPGIDIRFFDDRMEKIDYSEKTDLVAISVETYTAKRAYQIASEYRRRGVAVVMGGFHATLMPDEVSEYAEAVMIGEAEGVWPRLIEDFQAGRMQRFYKSEGRPSLAGIQPDRSIFRGKRYLPLGLIEAGRGCHLKCEFCAIQSYFSSTQTRRPSHDICAEAESMKKPLYFFVDDNITSNLQQAKDLYRKLAPLKIRWVSQASINVAHDDEFLSLIKASGCQGLLIGIETLNVANLKKMQKSFNTMKGGYEVALENLRRHRIRLYVTFILGYDEDTRETIEEALAFAKRHRFYIVAFNHLTPFPGTPLYGRLQSEGRLLFDKWWLDDRYRYGMVPYTPKGMTPDEVKEACIDARARFYSLGSIWKRSLDFRVNSSSFYMWSQFFTINWLIRREVTERRDYPLGDETFRGPLLRVGD
jgi:radical SAM superfamily enzyme YgiQ (UPF0313 family)